MGGRSNGDNNLNELISVNFTVFDYAQDNKINRIQLTVIITVYMVRDRKSKLCPFSLENQLFFNTDFVNGNQVSTISIS